MLSPLCTVPSTRPLTAAPVPTSLVRNFPDRQPCTNFLKSAAYGSWLNSDDTPSPSEKVVPDYLDSISVSSGHAPSVDQHVTIATPTPAIGATYRRYVTSSAPVATSPHRKIDLQNRSVLNDRQRMQHLACADRNIATDTPHGGFGNPERHTGQAIVEPGRHAHDFRLRYRNNPPPAEGTTHFSHAAGIAKKTGLTCFAKHR